MSTVASNIRYTVHSVHHEDAVLPLGGLVKFPQFQNGAFQ